MLIVDPHAEYGKAAVLVSSLDDLEAFLRTAGPKWRIAYSPPKGTLDREFPVLCEAVFDMQNLVYIVEEADFYCSPNRIPQRFAELVKYGRHPNVDLWAVARRPAEIHRLITSQAWEMYAFAADEPPDRDYYDKKLGPEYSERIWNLPPHRCLRFNLFDRREPVQEIEVHAL